MSSQLKFDAVTIGATTIDTDEFVHGSGRMPLGGNDVAVTTADGRIHNIRQTIIPSLEFECYGDLTTLNTAAGLGVAVEAFRGGGSGTTVFQALTGVVTAAYDTSRRTTRVSVKCSPLVALT